MNSCHCKSDAQTHTNARAQESFTFVLLTESQAETEGNHGGNEITFIIL